MWHFELIDFHYLRSHVAQGYIHIEPRRAGWERSHTHPRARHQ